MKNKFIENAKIMIVDDQPENLGVLFEYLDNMNADVMLLQEGAEAIKLVETGHADIILLDIIMPGMNGFDVCKKLKENEKTADIPVIFISALGDTENIVKGFECGGVDYVTKPVQKEEVIARITNQLNICYVEKEIRKLNSELEHRVIERTAELETANRDLKDEIVRRRQAEISILKEKDYSERIIKASPAIICGLFSTGTVVFINAAGERITGYSLKEIIGRNWFQLLYPDEEYRQVENLFKELKKGDILDYEMTLTTKNNEKKIVSWNFVNRFDKNGDIIQITGFGNEITERKKLQEEKRKLEKQIIYSEKMNALGTLAGGIAHDFNNILGVIIGYIELTLTSLPDEQSVNDMLKPALKACHRATGLVKQMLSFSHQTEQEKMPVNINLLTKETLNFIRASLPATIEIQHNITNISRMVMADPTQIHQILMNLFTNAAHAMKEKGGLLYVSLVNKDITTEMLRKDLPAGKYACLIVKDTGYGMTPDVMEKMFEAHFTTKKPGEGTGLGLSIVHKIVKNHRGAIEVESVSGEGSTFYIYLPLIDTGVKAEDKKIEKFQKGKGRILLVDDDLELFHVEKIMIEMLGYEVVGQTSSLDAFDIFQSAPDQFDLVITDYTMPHMTGLALAEKLLNIKPDIPVVLCSGSDNKDFQIGNTGIRKFIMKPFDIIEIDKIIRELLADSQF